MLVVHAEPSSLKKVLGFQSIRTNVPFHDHPVKYGLLACFVHIFRPIALPP
jgi:hypothetical protein